MPLGACSRSPPKRRSQLLLPRLVSSRDPAEDQHRYVRQDGRSGAVRSAAAGAPQPTAASEPKSAARCPACARHALPHHTPSERILSPSRRCRGGWLTPGIGCRWALKATSLEKLRCPKQPRRLHGALDPPAVSATATSHLRTLAPGHTTSQDTPRIDSKKVTIQPS